MFFYYVDRNSYSGGRINGRKLFHRQKGWQNPASHPIKKAVLEVQAGPLSNSNARPHKVNPLYHQSAPIPWRSNPELASLDIRISLIQNIVMTISPYFVGISLRGSSRPSPKDSMDVSSPSGHL